MNLGKMLLGALTGLVVGTLLGIFFAPEKGRVTRKSLSRKGEYIFGTAKDKLYEFRKNVSEKFEDVKKVVFKK